MDTFMTAFKIILVIALAASVIVSCSEKDDPEPGEEFLAQLAGHWTLEGGSVKLDDSDVGGAFAEFEITFNSDKSYSTSASVDPIWPASGTFGLEENDLGLHNLLRNDGAKIVITELTAQSLKFHQQYETPESRTKSISGEYYFSMKRE